MVKRDDSFKMQAINYFLTPAPLLINLIKKPFIIYQLFIKCNLKVEDWQV